MGRDVLHLQSWRCADTDSSLDLLAHAPAPQRSVGKLKDLGNNILGRFGLSLDNFKAEKDPETGSYSINFNKK